MLFGHGDDHYNSQKEVKINFSSNVWHGADLRTQGTPERAVL